MTFFTCGTIQLYGSLELVCSNWKSEKREEKSEMEKKEEKNKKKFTK